MQVSFLTKMNLPIKLFFCILSSSVLMMMFFCCGMCVALQCWEPLNYRTIIHPTTQAVVNVTYVRFIKMLYGYYGYGKVLQTNGLTKQDCSNSCFDMDNCIMWSYRNSNKNCRCYPYSLRKKTYMAMTTTLYESFEIKVSISFT